MTPREEEKMARMMVCPKAGKCKVRKCTVHREPHAADMGCPLPCLFRGRPVKIVRCVPVKRAEAGK
jgi:hypothetical protein